MKHGGVEAVQRRRVGKECLSYLDVLGGGVTAIDAAFDSQVFTDLSLERGHALWS